MTRLEELIYSLVVVIVRYHDIHTKVKKVVPECEEPLLSKKYQACAVAMIQNKEIDFKTRLTALIKDCSENGRKPFFSYILHELAILKELNDKKCSFEPAQLEEYKNLINQMLTQFHSLLNTAKSSTCKVTYGKTELTAATTINLSGLKNDGYYGGDLCESGKLLNDGVLGVLNLDKNSSLNDIKEVTERLCMEHQNALLIPELLAQNETLKKANEEQKQASNLLTIQHQEEQKKLEGIIKKQQITLYAGCVLFNKFKGKDTGNTKAQEEKTSDLSKGKTQIMSLFRPPSW